MSARNWRSSSTTRARTWSKSRPKAVLVQVVGRLDQFRWAVIALGEQDAVLHVAVGGDDDQQHALVRQAEELDLADARLLAARRHDDAGEGGELRQQLRGMADHELRLVGVDGFLDLGKLAALQGRTVSSESTNRR
jgi:hypothetical protein